MRSMSDKKNWLRLAAASVIVAAALAALRCSIVIAATAPPAQASASQQVAVFAGGCFWGVDAVFKHVKGVTEVVSGYSGGGADTASYETVSTGETGHAESVRIA